MADGLEVVEDQKEQQQITGYDDGKVVERLDTMLKRFDSLEDAIRGLETRNEASKADTGSSDTVVALNDAQWQELVEGYHWAKDSAGVLLFLVLLIALGVAAIFGSGLWTLFVRGWRR